LAAAPGSPIMAGPWRRQRRLWFRSRIGAALRAGTTL